MSVVTTLLISFPHPLDRLESDFHAEFSDWFEPIGGIKPIADLGPPQDEAWRIWGGNKYPECNLWGGAYNKLEHVAFWRHMNSLAWKEPHDVQVFMKDEEDMRFQVWMIRDGAFRRLIDGDADA